MNSIRFLLSTLIVGLALAPRTNGEVVNDGSSAAGLLRLANLAGANGADATLTPQTIGTNRTLLAEQTVEGLPFFALRNVWYAVERAPTSAVYRVSAQFEPSAAQAENRGGVMGWLDLKTSRGIAFYVRPAAVFGEEAAFAVATVDFAAASGDANESLTGLYNLDGTAASVAFGSAESELGSYEASQPATLELVFEAATAADRAVVSNATARVTAKAYQTVNGASVRVGQTIQLLTDLPLPEQHRFGYFAYWASIFGLGPIGYLDNLQVEGGVTVPPNATPQVELVEPADGAAFTVPVDVAFAAKVTDPDGVVTKVEFFAGSTLIGTVEPNASSSVQVGVVWTNAPSGVHSISVRVTDNRGGVSHSTNLSRITIAGGEPPMLGITFEGQDTIVSWPETASGFRLQVTTDLFNASWTDLPVTQTNRLVRPPTQPAEFFRMIQ